jgi:alpha-beta hydrolase superfamily lysophospholipase
MPAGWDDRRVRRRSRTITPVLPAEIDVRDGLAYSLWLPDGPPRPRGGVVILHGAGSCKENHHDFARAALAAGFGALAFDQRGHGDSAGPMDARALEDVAAMAALLRERLGGTGAPVALRGSSMGGYIAILAAPIAGAQAVVAICPASGEGLRRGLVSGSFRFDADVEAVEAMLAGQDLHAAVRALAVPMLLLHAEGDEQVPVAHSRELAEGFSAPGSRLITVPGGHHRSVQHDPELRAITLRFLSVAFAGASPANA